MSNAFILGQDNKIRAKVVSKDRVEYNGGTMILTGLAKKLLKKTKGVPGPDYFSYDGKKLNDIRREKGLINF